MKYHQINRNVTVEPYGYQNETVNRLIPDKSAVWVVNAKMGRRLVTMPLNATPQEAYNQYQDLYMQK